MAFDYAQTFFVDPAVVKGATDVGITAVELFFRGKPKKTNNKSGIDSPGVEVTIAETINRVPVLTQLSAIRPQEPTEHGARFLVKNEIARKEWSEIQASSDASAPTVFRFGRPVRFKTGKEYAIVIKFDGHEDYILWFSKQGDDLLGTTTPSPGPNGKYVGQFFGYISPTNNDNNPSAAGYGYSNTVLDNSGADEASLTFTDTSSPNATTSPDQSYINDAWRPIPQIDLKFRVYVARYAHNGVRISANGIYDDSIATYASISPTNVSNNIIRITAPSYSYEYMLFDKNYSNTENIRYGDTYYQEGPLYPGGTSTPLTIAISNNSSNVTANGSYLYANGTTFNNANGWNAVYPRETDNEYIVIHAGPEVFVRKVQSVLSNTVLQVDEPIPATNTVCTFQKTAVGRLFAKSSSYLFGTDDDICILSDTNANSSIRFVNNAILSITVSNTAAAGPGYTNSDYLVISGYEDVSGKVTGGYSAVANMVTNSTGYVTTINLSNTGCGFVNTSWLTGANVVVNNSSGLPVPAGTANGVEDELVYTISSRIRSSLTAGNGYFSNIEVINIDLDKIKPEITVDNPLGTAFIIKHGTLYYKVDDDTTFSGNVMHVQTSPSSTEMVVKIFKDHEFVNANNPVYPSRSNEFVATFANGTASNSSIWGNEYSNAAIFAFETSSNNDFTSVFLQPEIINSHYAKYVINNDYTNEHTNYGNAYAKHIVNKVSFQEDRFAEDIVVYLTAYRPLGTDFKVYVRLHNSADPEAFDDKDWTLLEQSDGIGVYSSIVDTSDYIELTYAPSLYPNNAFIQGNSVVTVNGSSNVTSVGFDANIAANDLVKIYSPIFPNNYVIDVVTSVTNSTLITLANPIANDNVIGSDMKLSKIGYPKQAFKNVLNDKVIKYYNEDMMEYDTYDTFQVKVVMLSNNQNIIPKIDDIRAIGVSA